MTTNPPLTKHMYTYICLHFNFLKLTVLAHHLTIDSFHNFYSYNKYQVDIDIKVTVSRDFLAFCSS